jgi:hypothetical protein
VVEKELKRREARRLFDALAEAAGSAMYDRLIGLLADNLPDHVVMRRGPQLAGGDALQRKALLTARARLLVRQRPLRVRLAPTGRGAGARVALAIEEVRVEDVRAVLERQEAAGGGKEDLELAALIRRQAPAPRPQQRPAGRRGGHQQRRSAAEVLAEAWQEDSDVNAQLGALVNVFGDAVLSHLPLGELPAFNL